MPTAIRFSAVSLVFVLSGCGSQFWNTLDWGQCEDYSLAYSSDMAGSDVLLTEVPAAQSPYAMALVLRQEAVNDMFASMANANLPELRESTRVLGQQVSVSMRPRLPQFSIGGNDRCRDCFSAHVPVDLGLSAAGLNLNTGGTAIDVQMPIRFQAVNSYETQLVAAFQELEVTGLDLPLPQEAQWVYDSIEPLVTTALTRFLQTEFEDATLAVVDSWSIGEGSVLLAPRGPVVDRSSGTVTLALQTNLPLDGVTSLSSLPALPSGADIGVIIHPGLISAMGRRMLYEGQIPHSYDENGQ
ncbi:MAG: hypothetical protein KC561_18375, partial [Myxococcales bacterium]|nr:hypothetical protein [Myxococcales bacterium]